MCKLKTCTFSHKETFTTEWIKYLNVWPSTLTFCWDGSDADTHRHTFWLHWWESGLRRRLRSTFMFDGKHGQIFTPVWMSVAGTEQEWSECLTPCAAQRTERNFFARRHSWSRNSHQRWCSLLMLLFFFFFSRWKSFWAACRPGVIEKRHGACDKSITRKTMNLPNGGTAYFYI